MSNKQIIGPFFFDELPVDQHISIRIKQQKQMTKNNFPTSWFSGTFLQSSSFMAQQQGS
jgi:hypothetical protein